MLKIATNIEKINASNYLNWAADIKYLLLENNLWNIVNQTENPPVPGVRKSEVITDTGEPKLDTYKVRSDQVLALIFLHVGSDFKRLMEDSKDPIEAWTVLKNNHCPDSRSHYMRLFSSLIE